MTHCHTYLAALRQLGYRLTPQREMVIETIAHSGCHMTAEEVYRLVQPRSKALNLATIYRTLDLLVETGLISRIDLGGGRIIYATDQHGPHLHLVCRCCGGVVDADDQLTTPLAKKLLLDYGFKADLQHASIRGVCSTCQAKS